MDKTKLDRAAFCRLYARHDLALYRYAYYRLHNVQDAQDAVADTVLEAYSHLHTLRDPAAFKSWIFTILHRVCNRYLTRRTTQAAHTETEAAAVSLAAPDTVSSTALELQEALATLTKEEQDIVLLSVVAGLSSREIAVLTGSKPGTVRSKCARSLKKMRAFLE